MTFQLSSLQCMAFCECSISIKFKSAQPTIPFISIMDFMSVHWEPFGLKVTSMVTVVMGHCAANTNFLYISVFQLQAHIGQMVRCTTTHNTSS